MFFIKLYIFMAIFNSIIGNDLKRSTLMETTTIKIDYKNEEIEAQHIINGANLWMKKYWMKLREVFINSNQKYSQINSGPLIQELNNNYSQFVSELAANLSGFHINGFQNTGIKRQILRLNKLQLRGLSIYKYEKSQHLLRKMKGFASTKNVCSFYSLDCHERLAYLPSIQEVIEHSSNPEKLKYYWESWRNDISKETIGYFTDYVQLFREAALLNGHLTPSKTWYLYYEDDNFLNELENSIKQLEPLYLEFHAYIRNILRKKYGDKITSYDGLIPEHLMEQVISHSWKAKSVYNPPFPNRLPNIKQQMIYEQFTPSKMVELAARFYNSLGIEDLPKSFWIKYSRQMSTDEEPADCKADVQYFPPEIGFKYCSKIDFKKFLQLHGNMAELHYAYHRSRLPFGLDSEACPGFASAIGEAAIIAAGSPSHLEKIELMENYTLNNNLSLNRLFRMGVHTIFTIPKYFVTEKYWVDVIDNRIDSNNLNCGYWEIQDKYAGVSPSSKRTNSHFDPGHKFYNGIDPSRSNTIKLVSELLGYQFYRSLCFKTKKYIPNDVLHPLHNCDFSSSKIAGKLLDEMMSLGSTKNWRDVMEILTGEREISASGILEYYYPLYIWLKEQNEKNDVYVGWDSETNCNS